MISAVLLSLPAVIAEEKKICGGQSLFLHHGRALLQIIISR
jgi:hypothetical protein